MNRPEPDTLTRGRTLPHLVFRWVDLALIVAILLTVIAPALFYGGLELVSGTSLTDLLLKAEALGLEFLP